MVRQSRMYILQCLLDDWWLKSGLQGPFWRIVMEKQNSELEKPKSFHPAWDISPLLYRVNSLKYPPLFFRRRYGVNQRIDHASLQGARHQLIRMRLSTEVSDDIDISRDYISKIELGSRPSVSQNIIRSLTMELVTTEEWLTKNTGWAYSTRDHREAVEFNLSWPIFDLTDNVQLSSDLSTITSLKKQEYIAL